jgi:hypothetical protein
VWANGSAGGTATVSGDGSSAEAPFGSGEATGTSTATGSAWAAIWAVGAAGGAATAAADGRVSVWSAGRADGSATATANGYASVWSAGSADGAATVVGVGYTTGGVVPVDEGTKAGGRVRRARRRERYWFEVNGEVFVADSIAEIEAVMAQVTEIAERQAPVAAQAKAARVAPGRPVRVAPPKLRYETDEIAVARVINDARRKLAKIYADAARDAEIQALLARRLQDEDDEESIMVLMA